MFSRCLAYAKQKSMILLLLLLLYIYIYIYLRFLCLGCDIIQYILYIYISIFFFSKHYFTRNPFVVSLRFAPVCDPYVRFCTRRPKRRDKTSFLHVVLSFVTVMFRRRNSRSRVSYDFCFSTTTKWRFAEGGRERTGRVYRTRKQRAKWRDVNTDGSSSTETVGTRLSTRVPRVPGSIARPIPKLPTYG